MPSASPWQTIVAAALVGTDRQPFTPPETDGAIAHLLAHLDNASDRALLSTAAVMALHQQAGYVPATTQQPLLPTCDLQDLPLCSPRAADFLRQLMTGDYQRALPEFLQALAATGCRVPELQLPTLLHLGRHQTLLRPLMLPVLGKRGRWLAAQHPDWHYIAGEDETTIWQTGNRAARLLVLQQWRSRDPDQARAALTTTWTQEAAGDRATFLAALKTGLTLADESFLESALEDRSKEVRRTAADLLARLPESGLCERMSERVRPLVSLQTGKKPKFDLTLPEARDAAMIRDGVEDKSTHSGNSELGDRGWWLCQMLGATPLHCWQTWFDLTPAEIIQRAGKGQWQKLLFQGWQMAIQRQGNPDWAEALFLATLPQRPWQSGLQMLPMERREALFLSLLESDQGMLSETSFSLLQGCTHLWSQRLTAAFVEGLQRAIASSRKQQLSYQVCWSLPDLGYFLNPALVEQAQTGWPTEAEGWQPWAAPINRLLALWQFRHDMLVALNPA